jgi:hypothetical protein
MNTPAAPIRLLVLLAVLIASALPVGAALALFTGAASIPYNTFSTGSWTSVQTGTASSPGGSCPDPGGCTTTVTINAVDPARSVLFFQTRHNSNRPPGSMIRGRIASSTSLEFVRVTDETSTISIRWYVVQFPSGVKVQRGEMIQDATAKNVTINAVASLNQAFVTWSKTPNNTDGVWSQDDPTLCELTTTANLQCRVNQSNAAHVIWWQVIEFTNAADINVQKGSASLLGSATSTNVTLPTAVNVSRTFVLVGYRTAGTGADAGSRMLRARLVNSTTVTIDRSISGSPDDITEIVWQAVELKDGSAVQSGSEAFAGGVAQRTVSISNVVTDRSVAFASVQPVGGQNMGRSPYAGDDIIGVCSTTMSLSSTQLTLDRNNTSHSCDLGWFVVQFAP